MEAAAPADPAGPDANAELRVFLSMCETHDDHGYKVLALRWKAVKAASKALLLYFRKKIKYEEDYASRLSAMSVELKYESDTAHVNTTEQQTVDTLRSELREASAVHVNVASRIKSEVLDELTTMRDGHKKIIRECFDGYDKATRAKNNSKVQHQRTEKHYVKCCSDLSSYREGSFNKTGKEAEKHALRTAEADQAAKAAEIKYKAMDEALKACIIECDASWSRTLVMLERVERQRLDAMRAKMIQYTNIHREGLAREDAIYARIADVTAQMSTNEDLANFVRLTADVKQGASTSGAGAGVSNFASLGRGQSVQSPTRDMMNVSARLASVDVTGASKDSVASSGSHYGSAQAVSQGADDAGAPSSSSVMSRNSTLSSSGPEIDYFDMSIEFPPVCQVVALYEYKAAIAEELSFAAGQRMNIIDKQESGWWVAECRSPRPRRGLIPSNFVKVCEERRGSSKSGSAADEKESEKKKM